MAERTGLSYAGIARLYRRGSSRTRRTLLRTVVSRETGPAEPVANWVPSMATEDVGFFGPAGRSLHGVEAALACLGRP